MPDHSILLNIPGLEEGLRMQLHPEGDQIISTRLKRDGYWELYETQLTLAHLRPGDVYVDVGANIGYYTLVAARCVGAGGKVIAYEPDPDNRALLEANVALNDLNQVQVFPFALYDKNTEGKLYLSGDNFGDHRVYASPEARESRSITLVHGGNHVSSLVDRIDFLKIDTQGAEFFVLNGLFDLVMQNRDHLRMIIEYCPWGIRKSGADGHDLLKLLDATGMQYHIIDHIGHTLIPAQSHHLAEWIDQLAVDADNEGFINLLVTPAGYPV